MKPNRETLVELYVKQELTQREIAECLGVSLSSVVRWFSIYKIREGDSSHNYGFVKNHVLLSEAAHEFLDGYLLGDGYLERSGCAARIAHTTSSKALLRWLIDKMEGYGIMCPNGITKAEYMRKGNPFTSYRAKSLNYGELKEVANRFYPNEKKVIPEDLRITPFSMLVEFLSDGEMWNQKRCSAQIQLCTDSSPKEDVQWLVGQLQEKGFSARYYACRNRVRINSCSVADFLDYIGPCPSELVRDLGHRWMPIFRSNQIRHYSPGENPGALTIL